LPSTDRVASEGADIAAEIHGSPIRELADRLAEEAARAAEYRVRLELTEQAQTSLEEALVAERVRREQAEQERDRLTAEVEALREVRESPEKAPEEPSGSMSVPEAREWFQGHEDESYGTPPQEAEDSLHRGARSWWRRFFGFE
jgi:hypothetical protein